MANWNDLKAAVAEVIKTNSNQEITGQILQNALNSIISNLGENATFAGIATPTTNPGTPDGNVFYIATEKGIYSNFNGIEIADGEAVILEWRGSWAKKTSGFATQKKQKELEQSISIPNKLGYWANGVFYPDDSNWISSDMIKVSVGDKFFCGNLNKGTYDKSLYVVAYYDRTNALIGGEEGSFNGVLEITEGIEFVTFTTFSSTGFYVYKLNNSDVDLLKSSLLNKNLLIRKGYYIQNVYTATTTVQADNWRSSYIIPIQGNEIFYCRDLSKGSYSGNDLNTVQFYDENLNVLADKSTMLSVQH